MKLLLLASLFAFSLSSFAVPTRTADAVYVKFKSMGSGIDRRLYDYNDEVIWDADRDGYVLEFTKNFWGREGEVTTCTEFNGFRIPRRYIKILARLIVRDRNINGHQRTDVYLGSSCHDISKATKQDIDSYLRD